MATKTTTVQRVEDEDYYEDVTTLERLAKIDQIINYALGVINVFLLLRLVFKAFGANPVSGIVQLVYSITNVLLAPFRGIFGVAAAGESVIEPSIFVAMLVYTLLAKGIMELLYIMVEE